ncbi:MAG: twin-arginine translocation signal domain-containing protein [Thermomicrobiales bacterium]|jgi:nitrous oxide reductase|nr:MAG: twin-arginine translocation signal domain-containing protein [Thermomicrobiales bacterium]
MEQKTNLKRRNFLRAVGAGGAAAAVAVGGQRAVETAKQVQTEAQSAKGYRLTQHIDNYYRTTRV